MDCAVRPVLRFFSEQAQIQVKVFQPESDLRPLLQHGEYFNGHRCGYVKLKPGHPWHGRDRRHIKADVHGGITFSEPDVACDKGGDDTGWWIGFDCGHAYDAVDPDLLAPGLTAPRKMDHQTIRTTEYVRENIYHLIAQAHNESKQETISCNR